MSGDVKNVMTRKERAAATRRRIIEAAAQEFVGSGYHGASMASIAKRAAVAVQTVYFVFHTKPELFAAVLDAAVLGSEDQAPLDQSWARAAVADAVDARAAITAFVRGSGPIFRRASALNDVAKAAAPTDPELAAVWSHREALRVRGYRQLLAALADRLPDQVDQHRAADILITLLSPGPYLSLLHVGWTHDEIIDWLAGSIPDLMLGTTSGQPADFRAR